MWGSVPLNGSLLKHHSCVSLGFHGLHHLNKIWEYLREIELNKPCSTGNYFANVKKETMINFTARLLNMLCMHKTDTQGYSKPDQAKQKSGKTYSSQRSQALHWGEFGVCLKCPRLMSARCLVLKGGGECSYAADGRSEASWP